MDKIQLETFITTAEQNSFSKAAILLNVTQPTVTARIKNLESELSCQLFNRIGKDIVLTKEGDIFLEYAKNIITYMNHSKEATKSINSPTIRVGFSPGYSYSFITELLKAVISIENLNIIIVEGKDSCSLNEQIIAGELDLVFTRNVSSNTPGIVTEYLFDNNLVVVLEKNHRLAHEKIISVKDLIGETLLSYRRNSTLWSEIDKQLVNVPRLKRIEVDNNEMLKKAVESGLGIGITPMLGIDTSNESALVIKRIEELDSIENKGYVHYRENSIIAKPIKKIIYSIINSNIKHAPSVNIH